MCATLSDAFVCVFSGTFSVCVCELVSVYMQRYWKCIQWLRVRVCGVCSCNGTLYIVSVSVSVRLCVCVCVCLCVCVRACVCVCQSDVSLESLRGLKVRISVNV